MASNLFKHGCIWSRNCPWDHVYSLLPVCVCTFRKTVGKPARQQIHEALSVVKADGRDPGVCACVRTLICVWVCVGVCLCMDLFVYWCGCDDMLQGPRPLLHVSICIYGNYTFEYIFISVSLEFLGKYASVRHVDEEMVWDVTNPWWWWWWWWRHRRDAQKQIRWMRRVQLQGCRKLGGVVKNNSNLETELKE